MFDNLCGTYETVTVIANSIGAFFAMSALADSKIEKAYFISPVVDMERLIRNMMQWANVTEDDLQKQKEIPTSFGETLSWAYLLLCEGASCYLDCSNAHSVWRKG